MLYLKKYVRFRKEADYLLICDCSIVQNYELPLETYQLFENLKTGYEQQQPLGLKMEADIVEDLIDLQLVDTKPNSNDGFHTKKWVDLGYEESEFF